MSEGVIEHDGLLWVPVLDKEFLDALAGAGFDLKRRKDWSQEIAEDYGRRRARFTKAKAEYASWIRKDRDSRMTLTAKTVAITMLECLNFDTGRCDPSHQFIADELGLSRRQIERIVPQIKAAGWIGIKRRGCKETNAYAFCVKPEKVAAILDYSDSLRERRREEREERKLAAFSMSDPTPMSDQSWSDPTSMRSPDPTSMSDLDPTPMSDKPLKGTSEGEPLNYSKGSDIEGYTVRAREEEQEEAYDPPATIEEARKKVIALGVPAHRTQTAIERLMRFALFPCDIEAWKEEVRDERAA